MGMFFFKWKLLKVFNFTSFSSPNYLTVFLCYTKVHFDKILSGLPRKELQFIKIVLCLNKMYQQCDVKVINS